MADSDKLGLGLDDIIRKDRTSNRRGGQRGFRGRTGGRGGGQSNGFRTRGGGGLPRTFNAPVGRWKHDLFDDNSNQVRTGQRTTGVNSTTKLLISNLDYNVTTSDVQELFEDVGAVRTARVHFDESGRSLGTAEVVFERRVDAVNAQQKYNGLNLDGRAMDIRLVGVDDGSQQQQQKNRGSYTNGMSGGNQRSGFRNNNQQNGFRGGANRSRGGGGGRQQQNGTNGNTKKENVTADDLDAELDAYRAESAPKK